MFDHHGGVALVLRQPHLVVPEQREPLADGRERRAALDLHRLLDLLPAVGREHEPRVGLRPGGEPVDPRDELRQPLLRRPAQAIEQLGVRRRQERLVDRERAVDEVAERLADAAAGPVSAGEPSARTTRSALTPRRPSGSAPA